MSDKTKIEWTDATWNPVSGCAKISPGCDNCYAETFAERFRGVPGHYYEKGFDLTLRPEKLVQPINWKRPRRIFVNSMSDLFHKNISNEYIAAVFGVMAASPQHQFQVLTKRSSLMKEWFEWHKKQVSERDLRFSKWRVCEDEAIEYVANLPAIGMLQPWPLSNVWLGVSIENGEQKSRIRHLQDTPAAVRFLSIEPLLGPVGELSLEGIHWVIVGGESGSGARPMHPDWVREIRDQCVAANVPFFFKQWGEYVPGLCHSDGESVYFRSQIRNDLVLNKIKADSECDKKAQDDTWWKRLHEFNEPWAIDANYEERPAAYKVGKRLAGRELDGREWNEFPGERA